MCIDVHLKWCHSSSAAMQIKIHKTTLIGYLHLSGLRFSPHFTPAWDHLGIFGHIILITYTASPWLLITVCLTLHITLDPIFLLTKYCTPTTWKTSMLQVYYICRPAYIIPMMGVARSLGFIILTGTGISQLFQNCFEYMSTTAFRVSSHLRPRVAKYFKDYDTLRIITTFIFKAFGGIIFTALTTVFIFTVVANNTWIRLRKEIPMPIYIYFPTMGLLAPVIMQVILLSLVAINDATNKIFMKCKFNIVRSNEMKYVRRRLRSMQPICVYGGIMGSNLFKCCNSNSFEYLSFYFIIFIYHIHIIFIYHFIIFIILVNVRLHCDSSHNLEESLKKLEHFQRGLVRNEKSANSSSSILGLQKRTLADTKNSRLKLNQVNDNNPSYSYGITT